MAAEAIVRFTGELAGLGQDKKVSARALLSDVPTKGAGPIVIAVATTPALLDLVGIISGELIGLYVKALSGKIHVSPYNTAVVTTQCNYIPEGQFNFYTYQTAITNIPSIQAVTAASQLEYLLVAIT